MSSDVFADPCVARTASTLRRRYGERARAEALVWCRHFAEAGEPHERRIWARVALAVRQAARNDNEAAASA